MSQLNKRNRIKRAARVLRANAGVVGMLALMWVIINESAAPIFVISGLLVAAVAVTATNRALRLDYAATIRLSPLAWARYQLFLFWEIAKSATLMAGVILRGGAPVTTFTFDSKLDHETLLYLLGTSIIMTPGSIAIDRQGPTFTVITCDPDPARAERDCRRMERRIARIGGASW